MDRRVAVVTGTSRGIGLSTAERLARDGFIVVGVARSLRVGSGPVWLDPAPAGIDNPIHFLRGDVEDPAIAESTISYALEQFGRLDVLVSNAGVQRDTPIELSVVEDYRATFDTNVGGFVSFARRAVPVMRRQGGGQICVVASVCSLRGVAGSSLYCGSKWAVLGIAESLQEELRSDHIRVSVVLPGWVNTAMGEPPDERYVPLILQPEHVADVISYIVNAPENVVLERVTIRPLVERAYSGLLDLPDRSSHP